MSNYSESKALTQSDQMYIGEMVCENLCKLKFKYFHDLDYIYVDTPCYYHTNGDVLKLQNDTLVYDTPVYKTQMNIMIYNCYLCGANELNYPIELNKPFNLGYCPYYEKAANKIICWAKKYIINDI